MAFVSVREAGVLNHATMNEARPLSPLEKQHLEQSRYCDFLQAAVEFQKHRQTLLAGYYDQAIKTQFEKEKAMKHAGAESGEQIC